MLPDDDKWYAIETCRSSESVLKKCIKINDIQLVHLLVVWYLVNPLYEIYLETVYKKYSFTLVTFFLISFHSTGTKKYAKIDNYVYETNHCSPLKKTMPFSLRSTWIVSYVALLHSNLEEEALLYPTKPCSHFSTRIGLRKKHSQFATMTYRSLTV